MESPRPFFPASQDIAFQNPVHPNFLFFSGQPHIYMGRLVDHEVLMDNPYMGKCEMLNSEQFHNVSTPQFPAPSQTFRYLRVVGVEGNRIKRHERLMDRPK